MSPAIKHSIVVALVALASACAAAQTDHTHAREVELLRATKIEVSDAIKAALAKAPGRVLDTELTAKAGRTLGEVDVLTAEGKVVEVDVDATSGEVLDSEEHRP
jgi:uncharacterized membrane protein YkoI